MYTFATFTISYIIATICQNQLTPAVIYNCHSNPLTTTLQTTILSLTCSAKYGSWYFIRTTAGAKMISTAAAYMLHKHDNNNNIIIIMVIIHHYRQIHAPCSRKQSLNLLRNIQCTHKQNVQSFGYLTSSNLWMLTYGCPCIQLSVYTHTIMHTLNKSMKYNNISEKVLYPSL